MRTRVKLVYWGGVWLPLLVPGAVAVLVHAVGVAPGRFDKIAQVLLMSLLYGGVPYALLALWASWWMRGRSEDEIQHLLRRAPVLMAVCFAVVSVVAGVAVGAPGPFLAVAVLGALMSLFLGYVYVGVVLMLRRLVG